MRVECASGRASVRVQRASGRASVRVECASGRASVRATRSLAHFFTRTKISSIFEKNRYYFKNSIYFLQKSTLFLCECKSVRVNV